MYLLFHRLLIYYQFGITIIHLGSCKKHLFMPFSFLLNILKIFGSYHLGKLNKAYCFHCLRIGMNYKGKKVFPKKVDFTPPTFLFLKNFCYFIEYFVFFTCF